jgi:hypothetical protein
MKTHPYLQLMGEDGISIDFTLDLEQPVEIRDFVSAFSGLGAQFERFIKVNHPDLDGEVKVYVKEVRKGSIEAQLIPLAYNTIISALDHALIATEFVKTVSARFDHFRAKGGRLPAASKTELTHIVDTIAAVANDTGGSARIASVRYRKSGKITDFAMEFDTSAARRAVEEIEAQYREISAVADFDFENKLLTFFQSNRKDADRTGEKGVIEDISTQPLAVVYASDLARERIKSEMLSGDRNVYKLGFFVDVNVQTRAGRPVAYRITSVRDVIELPDD